MLGLQHLNELGISHRDISPDNILIDHMGKYKLSDIGGSKSLVEFEKTHTITDVIGKLSYMSPELVIESEKIKKSS